MPGTKVLPSARTCQPNQKAFKGTCSVDIVQNYYVLKSEILSVPRPLAQGMECFPILLCVVTQLRLKQVHDAEEADLRKELASIEADAGFARSRCCNSKSDATGIEQLQSFLSESWQVFQDKFSFGRFHIESRYGPGWGGVV